MTNMKKEKTSKHPKVFISYSWKSEDYKDRVLKLAARLRGDGVDVILDRWHLKYGQDLYHFMENSIRISDKVFILCEESYTEKANNRSGGVGSETIITTPEVYGKPEQQKFIPIIMELPASFPSYLKSRLAIDNSCDCGYESILYAAYGITSDNMPPVVGEMPEHVEKRLSGLENGLNKRYKSFESDETIIIDNPMKAPTLGRIPEIVKNSLDKSDRNISKKEPDGRSEPEKSEEPNRDELGNTEISIEFAKALLNALNNQSNPEKAKELLEDLRELHRDEPENAEISLVFAKGLFHSLCDQYNPEKASELLEELRKMHRDKPGNAEISLVFAKGLISVLDIQYDPAKAEELLEELSELHRDDPENAEISTELAKGLFHFFCDQYDPEKAGELLEKLRELHRDVPWNVEAVRALAKALLNVFNRQSDMDKAGELLEELRELHREEPENAEVAGVLAMGLLNAFNHQPDSKKADELYKELCELHWNDMGNSEITWAFVRAHKRL